MNLNYYETIFSGLKKKKYARSIVHGKERWVLQKKSESSVGEN